MQSINGRGGGLVMTALYFSSEILFSTFDIFDFNINRGPFYPDTKIKS